MNCRCWSDKPRWTNHPLPAPMHIQFHFNPIRELEWMIRTLGIFRRHKIPIGEKAHALYLYMAGPSSWEIADMMEDRYGRKPSHSSVLDWAHASGSVRWTIPPRERRPVAVDWNETAEKANGREVYVCAAINVDTGELPAIKASWVQWSSGLGAPRTPSSSWAGCSGPARTNRCSSWRGGPWYSWAFRELGLEYCRGAFGSVTLSSPPTRARKSGAARSARVASPLLFTQAGASSGPHPRTRSPAWT